MYNNLMDIYSKRLNCGHVTMGFLHNACWFVKYSVIIESSVMVDGFDVATPGPPPPPGSLDICFCSDLHAAVVEN